MSSGIRSVRFRFDCLAAVVLAAISLLMPMGTHSAYALPPALPITGLTSSTHPSSTVWSQQRDASFSWDAPTSFRNYSYSVDHNPTDPGLDTGADLLRPAYAPGASVSLNSWFSGSQAVADFNNDGMLDLAVSSDHMRLSMLLGNGNGTFQPCTQTDLGYLRTGTDVVAGDFNGDGKMDAALALAASREPVAILLGNGDGTFQPVTYIAGATWGDRKGITAADFDGDGKLDVAFTDLADTGSVTVCRGKGDGTFYAGDVYSLPTGRFQPYLVAAGDVTGDGRPDLAAGDLLSSNVFLLRNDGSGAFPAGFEQLPVGGETFGIVIADVNEDGKGDIVAGFRSFNVDEPITLLLNNGDGSSFTRKAVANDFAQYGHLKAADMNSDGHLDLVGFNYRSYVGVAAVDVYAGDGAGNFSAARSMQPAVPSVLNSGLGTGDFNRDGLPDVTVGNMGDRSVIPMLALPGAGIDGLADGTWYFHIRAFDGLSSGPVSDYRFMIDATGPDVDMVGLTNGDTYLADALPTPSIVASDPNMPDASGLSIIEWSCSNGESGSSSASGIPITLPSAPGWYSYTVRATDLAGNVGPSRVFSLAIGLSSPKSVTFGPSSPTATTLRWAGCVGADGYNVYLDGRLAGTTGADVSAFTFNSLFGPSHVIEVEAYIAEEEEQTTSARTRGVYGLVKAVRIGEIRFGPNSTKLTPRTKKSLRAFAALAKEQGFTTVYVDGYSAHRDHGSKRFRAKISRARAKAVKTYLTAQFKAMNVDIRVVAVGQGAVPGSSQGHAPDRKAVISVK